MISTCPDSQCVWGGGLYEKGIQKKFYVKEVKA